MKISEMSTDAALDTMARVSAAVTNIVDDEKCEPVIDALGKLNNRASLMDLLNVFFRALPLVAGTHKRDVFNILSALTQKPVAAVMKQPLMETIKDAKASIDPELVDFFTPSAQQSEKAAGEQATE